MVAGAWVTVSLTVTNAGANDIWLYDPLIGFAAGAGLVTWIIGPLPGGGVWLPTGVSQTFDWSYSTSGAGSVVFTASATGVDLVTFLDVQTMMAAATLTISPAVSPTLVATMTVTPSVPTMGETVVVALTVSNVGSVAVNAVTPAIQITTGGALAVLVSGPVPSGPLALAPGGGVTFVWTYSASGAGTVAMTATATGTNAGNGATELAAGTGAWTTSISLPAAVDNVTLAWSTGGNGNWFGQSAQSFFGGDAAQSGAIADGQTSFLETTVTGPGSLTFFWRVDSEPGWDFLTLFIDGTPQVGAISGFVGWTPVTVPIPSGTHTIRWEYSKDAFCCASGADAAWVDQVAYEPTCGSASVTVVKTQSPPSGSSLAPG
ncbi:MAG: hypothetical protein AAB368_06480, partial [bacterium]